MNYPAAWIIALHLACLGGLHGSDVGSPRILGAYDAARYIDVCKGVPKEIADVFSLHDALQNDDQYEQVIEMPNGEVLVLVSGFGNAGLVVFEAGTPKIERVYSWSDYLRGQGVVIHAMDRAYYRLEEKDGMWTFVAELHAITDRRNGDHYLWQFEYSPGRSGSSLRYKLKGS